MTHAGAGGPHDPPPYQRPQAADGLASRGGTAVGILLLGVAATVFIQAILAGVFLSGVGSARMAHVILGWLLPWLALVVAVVAVVMRTQRQCSLAVAVGAGALPVLLWVQEVLGHVPFPVSTAVHVPFGVALVAFPLTLGLAALRNGGRPRPPSPSQH